MTGVVISGDTRGGVGGKGAARKGVAPALKPEQYRAIAGAAAAKLAEAWNKADAKALAGLFAEKADFIAMGGGMISGRDKIQSAHENLFKDGKAKAEFRVIKVKPLAPDMMLAMLGQRLSGAAGAVRTRPTAILRRFGPQDWRVIHYQVTRVAGAAQAPAKAAPAKAEASKTPAKPAKSAPAKAAAPAKKTKGK